MNNTDYNITLSVRANSIILSVFNKAKEYQPINRNAIFLEAVELALKTPVDWKAVAIAAAEYNVRSEEPGPDFIQLRLPRTQWESIIESINSSFKASLKRLFTAYAVKLVMVNYLRYLSGINNTQENCDERLIPEAKKISAPEMAAILTTMIIEKSPALDEIQEIMRKYKNGDYL